MAPPNINVDVQPTQNGKAYYLPIAAKAAGEPELVKIVLRLRITNNESRAITLKDITFSYPNTNIIPSTMKGEKLAMDPAGQADPNDGVIAPGTIAVWSNGVVDLDTSEEGVNMKRNEVYLNAPAPAKVKVHLAFERFSDPFTMTMDLIPYTNPTGAGSFLLPFSVADLLCTRSEFCEESSLRSSCNSAFSAFNRHFYAEAAKIHRGPQRKPITYATFCAKLRRPGPQRVCGHFGGTLGQRRRRWYTDLCS